MKFSKRSTIGALCVVSIFAAGFIARGLVGHSTLSLVPSAQAQDGANSGSRRCSNRTLKGAYGIKFEGQKVSGELFASVSRITFDGEGHFTTNEVGRFNGEQVQRTFTGPYTVNDDCTGFLDFSSNLTNPPHEAHGNLVIVDEGREFFVVDNEDNWAADGVGKKL